MLLLYWVGTLEKSRRPLDEAAVIKDKQKRNRKEEFH